MGYYICWWGVVPFALEVPMLKNFLVAAVLALAFANAARTIYPCGYAAVGETEVAANLTEI